MHFQVYLHTSQLEEAAVIVRVLYKYAGRIQKNIYSELDF
jgi:hypothetical protein